MEGTEPNVSQGHGEHLVCEAQERPGEVAVKVYPGHTGPELAFTPVSSNHPMHETLAWEGQQFLGYFQIWIILKKNLKSDIFPDTSI
jgi:hypothetical protein